MSRAMNYLGGISVFSPRPLDAADCERVGTLNFLPNAAPLHGRRITWRGPDKRPQGGGWLVADEGARHAGGGGRRSQRRCQSAFCANQRFPR